MPWRIVALLQPKMTTYLGFVDLDSLIIVQQDIVARLPFTSQSLENIRHLITSSLVESMQQSASKVPSRYSMLAFAYAGSLLASTACPSWSNKRTIFA